VDCLPDFRAVGACKLISKTVVGKIQMRRYAYLKEPIKTNKKDSIYKIMLYQTKKDGVYLFMYCQKDAVQCSFDYWYKTVEDVYEDWNDLVNEKGWIPIGDPLPYCQHDAFLPIRVKGRDIGEPQWGKLEILENGKWKEYIPDQ
jgi:hypothetical protein